MTYTKLTTTQRSALKAAATVREVIHTRGTGSAHVAGVDISVHTLRALAERGLAECFHRCLSRTYGGRRLGLGRCFESATSYWRVTDAGRELLNETTPAEVA
jgi:hypothetical protein